MSKIIDITKPVQTVNGRKVFGLTRLHVPGLNFPLVGVIEGEDIPKTWGDEGNFYRDGLSYYENIVIVKEKKFVPLTREDIKPTDVFRLKTWDYGFQTIGWINNYCINLNGSNVNISFNGLKDDYNISRDGGITWEKCEKEVEE